MWIGFSIVISAKDLENTLRNFLAPKSVAITAELPEGEWPDILGVIQSNDSEFPVLIDFYKLEADEEKAQTLCLKMAKFLSVEMGCRTICDGSGYGDDESPYWSIIWDGGRSYLADDCETTFGDNVKSKPVVIVREIFLQT